MNILWIGGTGRSGTTALWRALQQHPSVATTRAECHVFSAPRGALHLMEAAIKFERSQLGPTIEGFWEVVDKWQPIIKDKYGDISPLCRSYVKDLQDGKNAIEAVRAFIFSVVDQSVGLAGDMSSRGWFCEKTPRNLTAARTILRVFPESRFIHIKRNPRGVIESWARMDWNPVGSDLTKTAKHLGTNWYHPFSMDSEWLRGQPNYLEIKLEDCCHEPHTIMDKVCNFVGLSPFVFKDPFDPKMVRRWEQREDRDLLDRLGAPFDKLMGYSWDNSLLIEQEAS